MRKSLIDENKWTDSRRIPPFVIYLNMAKLLGVTIMLLNPITHNILFVFVYSFNALNVISLP